MVPDTIPVPVACWLNAELSRAVLLDVCVLLCNRRTGNRRGEDNAVNAEFQYKYDNEEVRLVYSSSSK